MKLIGLIPLLFAQIINTGGYRKLPASPCSPPTMTSRWAAYNPANTCTTGSTSPCTNGQIAWIAPDFNSVYAMGRQVNSANPIFTTNAINTSLPSWAFSSSVPDFFNVTPIPSSITTYTFYVIFKLTTTGAYQIFFSAGTGGGLVYFISDTNHQGIALTGAGTNLGTATFTSGVWYAVAMTVNTSTSAYAFYKCSGGTCSSDGSGTGSLASTQPIVWFGNDPVSGLALNAQIAEAGFLNGINITGIGPWVSCKYGV